MTKSVIQGEMLLSPAEVARMFGVAPKTITRWEKAGRISSVRTPGNHRRYPYSAVMELLEDCTQER